MAENTVPRREDVAEEFTWNLKDIFESNEAWTAEFEALGAMPEAVAAYQGRLGESSETLLEYLRFGDELGVRMEKLYGYANCKSDEDTANGFYQDMRGKAVGLFAAVSAASAFAAPEIMEISDETLNGFFAECPELAEYRRGIYLIRRMAGHILSPGEERLLASLGEVAETPDNIAGIFRDADLRFPDVADADGELHQLTNGTLVPLLESGDRVLRKNTFEAYYNRLGEFENTVAATLDAQFKLLRFFASARKYESVLSAALDGREIPESVYTNLVDAVHDNLDKMYRYVALRKKLLGVDELHIYDVYPPVVADAGTKCSFEDSKETVLKALSVLGEDYCDVLREGFAKRWIDVYENEGKRGGAYSSGSARPHPYVLLNHKDNLDGMLTVAHEMGHALHSYYSCKNQPVSTSDYVIFVAEVASTCNEILTLRYLLDRSGDKTERAYLINHFLDSFKGTVYRQTMFAEFELLMGELSESGATLTAELLNDEYYRLNELYFGPDIVLDDGIAREWARIPHFFYNYYVFQYATGFSAAVAIANRILSEGAPAVEDYKRFLSSGGSDDPISLLRLAGVDMSTPEPVNSALALFGELVDELEKLLA